MKNNIKYFLSLIALLALVVCVGEMVMAENSEVIVEPLTVNAEDIGIETIKNDAVIEEVIEDEIVDDSEDIAEEEVVEEEIDDEYIEDDFIESEDEIVTDDSALENEPETESPEVPEGMCEGYEEGIYFEPNHFGDCELHEYCYICPECTIEEELFIDEDINPNNGWVLSKTCIVCGHGGCEPVTDKFVDAYCAK